MTTTIQLLAAAGDWAAGSIVTVDQKQAERLIRTGYAVAVQHDMGLTGAKRKKKDEVH